jgi:hypothetical protein
MRWYSPLVAGPRAPHRSPPLAPPLALATEPRYATLPLRPALASHPGAQSSLLIILGCRTPSPRPPPTLPRSCYRTSCKPSSASRRAYDPGTDPRITSCNPPLGRQASIRLRARHRPCIIALQTPPGGRAYDEGSGTSPRIFSPSATFAHRLARQSAHQSALRSPLVLRPGLRLGLRLGLVWAASLATLGLRLGYAWASLCASRPPSRLTSRIPSRLTSRISATSALPSAPAYAPPRRQLHRSSPLPATRLDLCSCDFAALYTILPPPLCLSRTHCISPRRAGQHTIRAVAPAHASRPATSLGGQG